VEKFGFLKSNFYVSENFKFQCDPFSNKKDVSHKGPVAANGACQKWHILFLDIFQRNWTHP
jgi:uncharacterized protein YbcC (UPF0753/DUF2309 family)